MAYLKIATIVRNFAFVLFVVVTFLNAQTKFDGTEAFGDRLVIGIIDSTWQSFNPYQIRSAHQQDIIFLIYGYGLLQQSGKFESPPALIDRYVYVSNRPSNLEWRFVLKRNIIFQDGSDLRNMDVKFTFEVLKKFGGFILNQPVDFSNIRSITTDGDLEIAFNLINPDNRFDEKLSNLPILSHTYYKDLINTGYSLFSKKKPMGLGPFRIVSYSRSGINLTYHPHYFAGRPFLNGISVRFFEDEQKLVNALVNEVVDYIELSDPVTARQLHQLMGRKLIVFTVPRPNKKVYFIGMNQRRFPLNNLAVRKAIQHVINKTQIVERFVRQNGGVANTLLDEDNPYYFKQAFKDEFDPTKALQLLKSAGWKINRRTGLLEKNGRPLTFELYFARNSFLEESIARTIKVYLSELGINVQPVPIDPLKKNEIIQSNNYTAIIGEYNYNPDFLYEAVEKFYYNILNGNSSEKNYQNDVIERLLLLAKTDKDLEKTLYQRFQIYLKRDVPVIFLFFNHRIIVAVNSRFRNIRTTFRVGDFFFYRLIPIENWFVPKPLQKYSF